MLYDVPSGFSSNTHFNVIVVSTIRAHERVAREPTAIVLTNGGKFVTDNALSERPPHSGDGVLPVFIFIYTRVARVRSTTPAPYPLLLIFDTIIGRVDGPWDTFHALARGRPTFWEGWAASSE